MKKIKLGIIGTGLAARNLHLPAIKKLKNKFEITAVCNHTEKKAADFSKIAGGVPYYLDYKEMLQKVEIDAVDIAVPIDLNYQVTIDCFKAGKNIFLEKPISANLEQAKRLIHKEHNYNKVAFLAENFRYRKVFAKAKELLSKKEIGEPYSLVWNIFNSLPEKNEYAQTKWRKFNKYSGGFTLDAGIHNIAAIRFLFGDFKNVHAKVQSVNPKIGTADTLQMFFEMKNGMNGIFNIYFSANGYGNDEFLIFGKKGTIQIVDDKLSLKRNGKTDKIYYFNDGYGYEAEFTDFYNAIVNKAKFVNTFKEGFKDLEVMIKAFESAQKKMLIKI
jgi:predicted dehydrogenase